MKTKIYFLALTVISAFGLQAQTIMNIHQSNGTVLQIPLNTIDSITYTISNPGNLASITTIAVTTITGTTAISGGNITNDGGSLITQRGICYSTSPSPTTANTIIISGSGSGTFTSNLTFLSANITYFVRAYATNSSGTAYGNEVSFTTTAGGGGIVTNPGQGVTFDGYAYSSIMLGNGQEWMSENLRTTIFANGDIIPNVIDEIQWDNLTTGAWCHYNNDNQFENPYGKLYNGYTVVDVRNVCPNSWHVPTDDEWFSLINYLGGLSIAGDKMKSAGTQYWEAPNTNATNESGFSGLPGGLAQGVSQDLDMNGTGNWWSSTLLIPNNGIWFYTLGWDIGSVLRTNGNPVSGYSVRCLKD